MKKEHKKLFEKNKERIEDAQSMKKLKKTVTKLRKQKKQEDYMKQHGLNVI